MMRKILGVVLLCLIGVSLVTEASADIGRRRGAIVERSVTRSRVVDRGQNVAAVVLPSTLAVRAVSLDAHSLRSADVAALAALQRERDLVAALQLQRERELLALRASTYRPLALEFESRRLSAIDYPLRSLGLASDSHCLGSVRALGLSGGCR